MPELAARPENIRNAVIDLQHTPGALKNVFLITVDCLRADHVGVIGGGRLTPHVDKIAEEGVVFSRAFANGPGTNQSFPSILSSTYFLMHGGMRLNPNAVTIAEVLKRHGYVTAGFHSNPFLSASLGWNKGFDYFYDFTEESKSPSAAVVGAQRSVLMKLLGGFLSKVGLTRNETFLRYAKRIYYRLKKLEFPYADASTLNSKVLEWLSRVGGESRKLFLWIHYMDPHYPYIPPEPYLEDFSTRREAFEFNLKIDYNNPSKEDLEVLRRLYQQEVRYADDAIGELIESFSEIGVLEDSILIIAADHGHAFSEHGRFGHSYDILYNEVIHVPLILWSPEQIPPQRVQIPVQLLDLFPTVSDLLGIRPPRACLGRSLTRIMNIGDSKAYPIFSESAEPDLINLRYNLDKTVISCILDRFKLIRNQLTGSVELYDIEEDFSERHNMVDDERDIYEALSFLINNHLRKVRLVRQLWGVKDSLNKSP